MKPSLALPIAGIIVVCACASALLADAAQGSARDAQQGLSLTAALQADAAPWPDAKTLEERRKSAENRRLFGSFEPLEITITSDFKAVMRDRDPQSTKTFPATITFPDNGSSVTLPLQIRTRGHSRRLRQTCDFAPLRLEFPKEEARKTMFEGYGPIKLGTHCRAVTEFEQYVLREYTVYRMYNLLTPYSFRARLAKVVYVDPGQKKTIASRYGVFIEDDDDVAKRMSGRISARPGLMFHNAHAETMVLMTLFEYMIGNTDMSMIKQHNVVIVQVPGTYYPVPYDFDYSGLVDAAYAVADTKAFGIQSVRDRLYRGPCKTAAELEPFFVKLRAAKPDIMALFDALPDMTANYRKDAQKYLEEFYRTIDRPNAAKAAFIDNCNNRQGM
jgi:hypothetical protein